MGHPKDTLVPMHIPNIYNYKNVKLFIAVPIILMLISIYFAMHLQLDSTLRGGASIIFETNSTISAPQLASEISASLHTTGVEIQNSREASRSLFR